jgi:DNA-binding CsgD family transcriptional regulator
VFETSVLELIDLIYAAALQADLWPKALEKLADLTHTEAPVLLLLEPTQRRLSGFAPRTDPEMVRAYREYWNHRNPLEQATRSRPAFEISSPETIMGASEFEKTPLYNEWWKLNKLGSAALETNLLFDGTFPVVLNINKRHGTGDYSAEDVSVFAIAARHFARAIEISRCISAGGIGVEAMAAALDGRSDGTILVDEHAHIIHATGLATTLLKSGEAFSVSGSAISIAGQPGVLERLVASCHPVESVAGGGGTAVVVRCNGSPLRITVAPVAARPPNAEVPWLDAPAPAAIITIHDPDAQRERRLDLWRERFGLTPAEARFALEVINGGGRRAAAQRFGISDTTARAHLSSIFGKTDVSRQSELVALLLEAV